MIERYAHDLETEERIIIQRSGIHAHISADTGAALSPVKGLLAGKRYYVSGTKVFLDTALFGSKSYPILGPYREYNQLEIPLSAQKAFGVKIHQRTNSGVYPENTPTREMLIHDGFTIKRAAFKIIAVQAHIHLPLDYPVQEHHCTLNTTRGRIVLTPFRSAGIEVPCIHLDPDEYFAFLGHYGPSSGVFLDWGC
jgi:propanediol utilization protein